MRKKINIIKAAGLLFLVLGTAIATQSFAITGPSAGAGVGSGLINVEPTGTGNLSVGEIAADTSTKFQITGTTANSSAFGLKVWPSSGSVNFQVRNDGVVSIASTTYIAGGICFGAIGATDCVSSWSGVGGGGVTSTPAGYITPGYFNSIAGTGGNYSFPASLSIATSTAPSGGVLFVNGNVGIGTASPQYSLDVFGTSNKLGLTYSYMQTYGPTGAELSADSSGNLHIIATRSFPSVLAKNILLAENDGKVGIATTTPTYPLTVAGVIHSSTGGYRFPDGTTQTTAATGGGGGSITTSSAVTAGYFPYWGTTSGLTGTSQIFASGTYIGIGKTNPTVPLDVTGTIYGTGVISAGTYFSAPASAITKYQPNGNTDIQFADYAGNVKVVIDTSGSPSATGNVGIGTTTPTVKLDVAGFNTTNSQLRVGSLEFQPYSLNNGFIAENTHYDGSNFKYTATGAAGLFYFSGAEGQFRFSPSGAAGASLTNSGKGNVIFKANADGSVALGGSIDNIASSYTGATALINSTGTGIGTLTPVAKLDVVNGTANTSGDIITNNVARITGANIAIGAAGDNGGTLNIVSNSALAANIGGSIGFGGRYSGTQEAHWAAIKGGKDTGTSGEYGGYLVFATRANGTVVSEAMRISAAGKVGISTTTPTYPLTVAGVIHSSTGGYRFPDGTTQTTAATGGGGGGGYGWTTSGTSVILATTTNFVGIGTTTPAYPLTVSGTSMFTGTMTIGTGGTGKITVGTVDPPYTINGAQYATYMPGMTGQKEETVGEVNIECRISNAECEYIIDFSKAEKGSDLWLFAKTTNLKTQMNKMTVLLTPSFNGKVWYEKDIKNNALKIFASPFSPFTIQDSTFLVSYRLTAPRFDSTKWLNTRNEPGVDGFIIND